MSVRNLEINKFLELVSSPTNNLSENDAIDCLRRLDNAYYIESNPLVSDEVYDRFYKRVSTAFPKNNYFKDVDAPVIGKNSIPMPFHMPGLDQKEIEDGSLVRWAEKNPGPYLISDKMDGLSVGIVYSKDDPLPKLNTRGRDGMCRDITYHTATLNVPRGIGLDLKIRGEIEMSEANYAPYLEADPDSNARNTVSGWIRREAVVEDLKNVDIIAYEIVEPRYSPEEQSRILNELGFKVVHHEMMEKLDLKELVTLVEQRKTESGYALDGVVIESNVKKERVTEGNPSYAIKFKIAGAESITEATVDFVEWNLSRTGRLQPRIHYHPVKLGEVTCTHTTGFHAAFIKRNNIGKGTVIRLVRAGDVVPNILGGVDDPQIIKANDKPDFPDDVEWVWDDTNVHIMSSGGDNSEQNIKKIIHFFSTLGVEGMKRGVVQTLYENGYESIQSIVHADPSDLIELPRFGIKKVRGIVEGIHNALVDVKLAKLMDASGEFPAGMGEKRMSEIVINVPNVLEYESGDESLIQQIISIQSFQETTAKMFVRGLSGFKDFIETIPVTIQDPTNQEETTSGDKLGGQVVLFTGVRDKALEETIKNEGGTIGGSFSGKTTILIAKDVNGSSSKIRKARENGVLIVGRDEFVERFDL